MDKFVRFNGGTTGDVIVQVDNIISVGPTIDTDGPGNLIYVEFCEYPILVTDSLDRIWEVLSGYDHGNR